MEKTLNDIQVGDKVITYGDGSYQGNRILNVIRTTRTQIICEHDTRFRKEDGYRIGGMSFESMRYIQFATPEYILMVETMEKNEVLKEHKLYIDKNNRELIHEVYDFLKEKNLLKKI